MNLDKMDISKIIAASAQAAADQPDPREAWVNQKGFNLVSLGDWLELCKRVGIDCVDAQAIAHVPVDALINFDVNPDHPGLTAAQDAIRQAKAPGYMLRWDMCAPAAVKANLDKGQAGWDPAFLDTFSIDDPRVYNLTYEYPGHTMTIWRRPWVKAALDQGYPIEYRAFVHEGDLKGISSYYPQRRLTLDDRVLDDVAAASAAARKLAEALPLPVRFPGSGAKRWSAWSRSFTADFMRLEDGRLLFLEAGPPFGAGAHPCCFPADTRRWDEPPSRLHEQAQVLYRLSGDAGRPEDTHLWGASAS